MTKILSEHVKHDGIGILLVCNERYQSFYFSLIMPQNHVKERESLIKVNVKRESELSNGTKIYKKPLFEILKNLESNKRNKPYSDKKISSAIWRKKQVDLK